MKRLLLAVVFLSLLAARVPAQQVVPNPAAPPPTLPPVSPEELKNLIYDQLETMNTEDLMKKVMRAHNILSRDGQEAIKDRALVRLAQKKAENAIDRFQANPNVDKVAKVLDSDAARNDLQQMIEIREKKVQEAAFADFLKKHGIKLADLRSLAEVRTAEMALEESEQALESIEAYLNRQTLPNTGGSVVAIGDFLDSVRGIRNKYGDKINSGQEVTDAGSGEDLASLLKALLRKPSPAGQR